MLSRTSLTASKAASGHATRLSRVRLNSTTPASTTAAPKRSIPLASAFADLLAPRAVSNKAPRKSAVGLSSLGDDQFDGLGRRPLLKRAPKADSQESSGMVDGVVLDFQSTPRAPRDARQGGNAQRDPARENSRRTQQNERSGGKERRVEGGQQNERAAWRERRPEGGQQNDRPNWRERRAEGTQQSERPNWRERRPEGGQQRLDRPRNDGPRNNANRTATPSTSESRVLRNNKNRPDIDVLAKPVKKPSPRPSVQPLVSSIALTTLFDTSLASQNRAIGIPLTDSIALMGTPTVAEAAGDYSRYLEHDIIARISRMEVLKPVDYARFTLAKRPDVSLEERSKAVEIMTRAAGFGSAQTATTARA